MGYRERLAGRVEPFLDPGERLLVAFPAQAGISPWMMGLSAAVAVWFVKPRVVAVTDRGIAVLRATKLRGRPKEILLRGPYTSLGEPGGLWHKFPLGDKTYVARRFHKDVRKANEVMQFGGSAAPPA